MILTKAERENLLAVKTTKEEARNMKKRFELLLETLRKPWTTKGRVAHVKIIVGCPHCDTAHEQENTKKYNFNCEECAYTEAALEKGMICEEGSHDFSCVKYFGFGEVYYEMIKHLISLDRTNLTIDMNPESMDRCERRDLETFAKGHIEWANLVLKAKK